MNDEQDLDCEFGDHCFCDEDEDENIICCVCGELE